MSSDSLIEILEYRRTNSAHSHPYYGAGYNDGLMDAIDIIRHHYEGRPAVEGKPLELMTRDELLNYIRTMEGQ